MKTVPFESKCVPCKIIRLLWSADDQKVSNSEVQKPRTSGEVVAWTQGSAAGEGAKEKGKKELSAWGAISFANQSIS